MKTAGVENARLGDLISELSCEKEIILTEGDVPVARLLPYAIPRVTPQQLAERTEAIENIRRLGGLSHVIPDPVAWQREMREDRPLPDLP